MSWKHWLYIIYILLAALVSAGIISCMSSCSVAHSLDTKGWTRIVTTDTTLINHVGTYKVAH